MSDSIGTMTQADAPMMLPFLSLIPTICQNKTCHVRKPAASLALTTQYSSKSILPSPDVSYCTCTCHESITRTSSKHEETQMYQHHLTEQVFYVSFLYNMTYNLEHSFQLSVSDVNSLLQPRQPFSPPLLPSTSPGDMRS